MKYTPATATHIARRYLQPGDAVLEIGAADGELTRIYAARVGPTGCVWSIEPHRQSVRQLRTRFANMPWVTVTHAAVSDRSGEQSFYPHRTNQKCGSLWVGNVSDPGDAYSVAVTTIDALAAAMPRTPRLIQIDAQGAEAAILRGASKALQLPIVWVLEVWPAGLHHAGACVDDVRRPFESHAYTPRNLQLNRLAWHKVTTSAAGRSGSKFVDFVMVPEDLVEAD